MRLPTADILKPVVVVIVVMVVIFMLTTMHGLPTADTPKPGRDGNPGTDVKRDTLGMRMMMRRHGPWLYWC